MNEIHVYLLGIIVVLLINSLLFFIFRPYLKKVLLEQNGGLEKPASFWVVYCGIVLYLVPIVFAMSITPNENISPFFQFSKQIKWSLVGTIISFLSFGLAIISFIPKKNTK